MIRTMNIDEMVVRNTLKKLQSVDPTLYAAVMDRMKSPPRMNGLGGFLDDFSSAFSGALNSAANLYVSKEQAKIAADQAKEIAKIEAMRAEQQLAMLRQQSQDQAQMQYYQQQQNDLNRYMAELEFSSKEKMMLWAAAGLAGILAVMVITRRRGR